MSEGVQECPTVERDGIQRREPEQKLRSDGTRDWRRDGRCNGRHRGQVFPCRGWMMCVMPLGKLKHVISQC